MQFFQIIHEACLPATPQPTRLFIILLVHKHLKIVLRLIQIYNSALSTEELIINTVI